MAREKIYIVFSNEIRYLLQSNLIDIPRVIRDEGIDVDISHEYIPYSEGDTNERTKDLVLVILASSAAILSIGNVISQIIRSVHRKPYFVEYSSLEEIRDQNGNVLLDRNGHLKPVKKFELLEPRAEQNKSQVEFKGDDKGVIVKYISMEDQTKNNS